jgi:hypothetical protein
MADFEASYNGFSSRFGDGNAANRRGSFARYLEESGGNKLAEFGGQMQGRFNAPGAINGQMENALGDAAEARNMEQWGQNLNRVTQQHGQFAELGFNSVSQAQQVAQAKEMAEMNAQSSRQGATFGAIQSGIGMLGGIGGKLFSGGGGGSSGINWQQTPTVSDISYGGSWF